MARRPPLSTAARDAWDLAVTAITAGLGDAARTFADRAVELSGWGPYMQGFTFWPRAIFYSSLLPTNWAYYARTDGMARLLVHPKAATFVAQIRILEPLFDAAERRGGGLLPLEELMGDVFTVAVTPPDDISELSA